MRIKLEAFKPTNMSNEAWSKYIEEIAPALGYFIISFNELDSEVSDALILLSGIETDHQFIALYPLIKSGTFSERTRLLARLLKFNASKTPNSDELISEINRVNNEIEKIGRIRNSYIHAEWNNMAIDENELYVYTKLKSENSNFHHEYFNCTLETIEGYEDKIDEIIDNLDNLIEKLVSKNDV